MCLIPNPQGLQGHCVEIMLASCPVVQSHQHNSLITWQSKFQLTTEILKKNGLNITNDNKHIEVCHVPDTFMSACIILFSSQPPEANHFITPFTDKETKWQITSLKSHCLCKEDESCCLPPGPSRLPITLGSCAIFTHTIPHPAGEEQAPCIHFLEHKSTKLHHPIL